MTIEAPTKFPTNISGVSLIRELTPTEISPIEVKSPSNINETRNEDVFNFLDIFSTDLTVIPDPTQTPKKEIKKIIR